MALLRREKVRPSRNCEFCGEEMKNPRPNRLYCDSTCRAAAFQQRRGNEEILAAQVHGVEDVERQLVEGRDLIYVEGRALQRESAWAAVAGIRAAWDIDGARHTGRVVHEGGQWWALVQVPLGEFPG